MQHVAVKFITFVSNKIVYLHNTISKGYKVYLSKKNMYIVFSVLFRHIY